MAPSADKSVRVVLLSFFEREGWAHEELPGKGLVRLAFAGRSGRWPVVAQWNEDEDQLVFYSVCPFTAPAERRAAIMELFTRINFGIPMGSFELDLEDGEMRVKAAMDFEDAAVDPLLVHHLFYIDVAVMDEYMPAIEAVMNGETPAEVLARLEPPPGSPE